MIFGIFITMIFGIVVLGAGILAYRFKQLRFVNAWQPLAPIIGGSVRGNGGGCTSSWLS